LGDFLGEDSEVTEAPAIGGILPEMQSLIIFCSLSAKKLNPSKSSTDSIFLVVFLVLGVLIHAKVPPLVGRRHFSFRYIRNRKT